jgi:cysteine desulfurase
VLNVAGIVGLGAAARLAMDHLATDAARIAQLRDELWTALSARVDGIGRHTPDGASLANTLLVSFPGVLGADVLTRVPELAASTGSACHAGEHTPNATLLAMGVSPEVALGALRLSLGRGTTRAEIQAAAELLAGAHQGLVAAMPPPTSPSTAKGAP